MHTYDADKSTAASSPFSATTRHCEASIHPPKSMTRLRQLPTTTTATTLIITTLPATTTPTAITCEDGDVDDDDGDDDGNGDF
jgi:hypothetical protein